jgi:hypothetical protein
MVDTVTKRLQFEQLEADTTVREFEFDEHVIRLDIDVTSPGAIRLGINSEPAALSGSLGILIPYEKPLHIENHLIKTVQFVRDDDVGTDVNFQLIGYLEYY